MMGHSLHLPGHLMQFMLAGLKTLMMPLQPPAARTGLPVSLSQLQAVLQQNWSVKTPVRCEAPHV